MKLNAYLSFPGTCGDAMEFYTKVLGGEMGQTMLYDDSPMASPESAGKILHTSFTFGDGNNVMAADSVGQPVAKESNVSLAIGSTDFDESERIFNDLSDGGNVVFPFQKTFWAKGFGMFSDKFGINWMVNCD